jgi:putative FmdB family regulatory protein
MPIYEYACQSCGKIFEEFQSFSAPPLKKCRLCNSPSIKRIVSNTSFILKGSGWYATDYSGKKQKGKDAGTKGGGGKDKSPGGKESSGESKDKKPSRPDQSHTHA